METVFTPNRVRIAANLTDTTRTSLNFPGIIFRGLFLAVVVCIFALPTSLKAQGELYVLIDHVSDKIRQAPGDEALYLRRGNLHFAHRDFNMALKDYKKAHILNPENSLPELCIAELYFANGDMSNAIIHAERFLSRNPGHIRGLLTRAFIYEEMGDIEFALNDMSKVMQLAHDPHPVLFNELAHVSLLNNPNHYQLAMAWLDRDMNASQLEYVLQKKIDQLESVKGSDSAMYTPELDENNLVANNRR